MDFYARVDALEHALRGAGFVAEADAIGNAVRSGSTGTEIFMALRWHLRQMDALRLPADIRAEATTIERDVARALRKADGC